MGHSRWGQGPEPAAAPRWRGGGLWPQQVAWATRGRPPPRVGEHQLWARAPAAGFRPAPEPSRGRSFRGWRLGQRAIPPPIRAGRMRGLACGSTGVFYSDPENRYPLNRRGAHRVPPNCTVAGHRVLDIVSQSACHGGTRGTIMAGARSCPAYATRIRESESCDEELLNIILLLRGDSRYGCPIISERSSLVVHQR